MYFSRPHPQKPPDLWWFIILQWFIMVIVSSETYRSTGPVLGGLRPLSTGWPQANAVECQEVHTLASDHRVHCASSKNRQVLGCLFDDSLNLRSPPPPGPVRPSNADNNLFIHINPSTDDLFDLAAALGPVDQPSRNGNSRSGGSVRQYLPSLIYYCYHVVILLTCIQLCLSLHLYLLRFNNLSLFLSLACNVIW